MVERRLNYDEASATAMLVALKACPAEMRMDTLAVVAKLFIEEQYAATWRAAPGAGEQR